MTTTEQLLLLDSHHEDYEVRPGVTVRIRSITLAERKTITTAMREDLLDSCAHLLAIACIDPATGAALFTLEQAFALQSTVADDLFDVASRLSGLSDDPTVDPDDEQAMADGVNEAGKDSTASPTTD